MVKMPWESIPLGEFVTLKRGYDLASSARRPGSVPVVSSSGVTGRHDMAMVKGPGVVTGRYGTLGEVFFIQEDFWPLNTSLYVQDFRGNDPRFAAYFLQSVLAKTNSDKAAVPGVNRNDLHARTVRVTRDVDQQDAIASILAAYDNLIENNRRRIRLLEQSARLLYEEWFLRLRFPGHESATVINGVPEGWRRTPVPRMVQVNPTEKAPPNAWVSYIPMAALSTTDMSVDLSRSERRTKSTSVRFRNGDTLLARITPCLENGKTGFVNFLDDGEVACGSTEFIVLRGASVSSYFVYCMARTQDFREAAIKSMIGSSGRQRVQPSCFNEFLVYFPPTSLQKEFDSYCETIFSQIAALAIENLKLSEARDLLLPRVMNGEISV